MSNREKAIETLREPIVRRIDFSFPSRITLRGAYVHINAYTFMHVASAIENDHIKIRPQPRSSHLAASYLAQPPGNEPNQMFLPGIIGRTQKKLVIHEAVHAKFDLDRTRIVNVPPEDQESACFIAEQLYCRLTGYPRLERNQSTSQIDQIAFIAQRIAGSILVGNGVPSTTLNRLRRLIATDPFYSRLSPIAYSGNG